MKHSVQGMAVATAAAFLYLSCASGASAATTRANRAPSWNLIGRSASDIHELDVNSVRSVDTEVFSARVRSTPTKLGRAKFARENSGATSQIDALYIDCGVRQYSINSITWYRDALVIRVSNFLDDIQFNETREGSIGEAQVDSVCATQGL